MSLTKLSLAGKNLTARESLVSDILAGDGKIDNLFYSVVKEKKICFYIEYLINDGKYLSLNDPR
jgi:hypothetical protein